jgi:hypothetical protein
MLFSQLLQMTTPRERLDNINGRCDYPPVDLATCKYLLKTGGLSPEDKAIILMYIEQWGIIAKIDEFRATLRNIRENPNDDNELQRVLEMSCTGPIVKLLNEYRDLSRMR